jgi:DnaJ-class molecular chaperone
MSRPQRMEDCQDCVGSGMIRREDTDGGKDIWDTCATCRGHGEVVIKVRYQRRK